MPIGSRLLPLQRRVLTLLAGVEPAWTLSGGAALAGVYLGHRTTRDLDLFWHGAKHLGAEIREIEQRLQRAGLTVAAIERHDGFVRLRVSEAGAAVVLDLVAEPVPWIEAPTTADIDGVRIGVDTPHEILVNKLCALLGRSEVRDLVDVRALLAAGGDLNRALMDAPAKDSGFSPLTLAWLLRNLEIDSLAPLEGLSPEETRELVAFRDDLVSRLATVTVRD